jgi:tetratricopeptide (TPR) repeat protein
MKQNSVRNSLTKFWLMTFLLLIGIAGPIIAQPPATESQPAKDPKVAQIEELVRQAQAALDKGQASEAEARCQQALKIDEKSTLARANLARVLATLDKQDEALKEIERALESPARDSDAREARSQAFAVKSSILYDRGEFLPAIDAAYLGTLEKYDNAELHLNRAKAYIARRDYDKAINSLNRAIGIDSKLAEAHSLRGFAYGLKENYGQCVNDQTKALELAPQYALALQRRASAYLQQKKPAEAVKDLDQALRLKPDLAEALCDRAIMRTVGRDTAGAMADVEAAIKSDPKCLRAHLLKAQALIGQERWDDAIKALDHSLKYGSDLAIYLTRGLAYQSRKKYGESIEDFTKVLEQDPQNLAAYKARAVSYRKAGNEELAKADLNMVRDLSPTPDEKETKDSKGKKKKDKSADEDKVPPPMLTLSNKPVEAKALQAVKQMAAEIDRLVAASHKKHQVQPNPKTTDEQFVRRVYLDLAGRIPSYQETTKFLSAKEADKRSALIDSLLGSDGYANHYFNYWADVLRYKDDLSNDVRG